MHQKIFVILNLYESFDSKPYMGQKNYPNIRIFQYFYHKFILY